MQKLLIAETATVFSAALADALSDLFQIRCCQTGTEALQLLETLRPDALIIDTALPYMDGLTVLHTTTHRPSMILALTTATTAYALQMLKNAGADYTVSLPCTVQCVVSHMRQLAGIAMSPVQVSDPQDITQTQLLRLGLPPHRAGFAQLRVGIPLFAQDEHQLLKKELYQAIAELCGNDNTEQVERAIRQVIKEAWQHRDKAVWEEYFPGSEKAPSNKKFIAVLAQQLRRLTPDRIW